MENQWSKGKSFCQAHFDRGENLSYIDSGVIDCVHSKYCTPTLGAGGTRFTSTIFHAYARRISQLPYRMDSDLKRRQAMLKPGTKIVMTKGYKGVKGVITEMTDSSFEFYIIKLDNGIHIVVGPSAFRTGKDPEDTQA